MAKNARIEIRPCPRCGLKVEGIVRSDTFPTPHDEFIPKTHPCYLASAPLFKTV